jgi:hypothetical protein
MVATGRRMKGVEKFMGPGGSVGARLLRRVRGIWNQVVSAHP